MTTIRQWANTFYVLGKVLGQTGIIEWYNPNSPFKESTPIPEWLDVFTKNKNEIKNLTGDIGWNFEYLDMWRTVILNSDFQGYITTFEFRRLFRIDRIYNRSIATTAINRAKKENIPYFPKTNEWGVTTNAFPIEFLEKICIEKGYL